MSALNGFVPCALIPDGYTFKGKVDARPGLWPEVNFKYRPALPNAANEYLAAARRTGEDSTEADVALIVRHVPSWDAADATGEALPLNALTLKRVFPPILTVMVNHILGYTPPQQEADVKNSDSASG